MVAITYARFTTSGHVHHSEFHDASNAITRNSPFVLTRLSTFRADTSTSMEVKVTDRV